MILAWLGPTPLNGKVVGRTGQNPTYESTMGSPSSTILVWDGHPEVFPELPTSTSVSALGAYRAFGRATAYSRAGAHPVRAVVPPWPSSRLRRFLASTFYNPRGIARIEYGPTRSFDLTELQTIVRRAIERDDDVLTQFYAAEDLLRRLNQATSF